MQYSNEQNNQNESKYPVKKKYKRLIITLIIIVFILFITIGIFVGINIHENAFDTSIKSSDFNFDYSITETSITVEITPQVDIKDFKFTICCGRTENMLHQYNNSYNVELATKGKKLTYKYFIAEIEKEVSWAVNWKINKVSISNIQGKKQNKYADKTDKTTEEEIIYNNECELLFSVHFTNAPSWGVAEQYNIYCEITNKTNKSISQILNIYVEVEFENNYLKASVKDIVFSTPLESNTTKKVSLETKSKTHNFQFTGADIYSISYKATYDVVYA